MCNSSSACSTWSEPMCRWKRQRSFFAAAAWQRPGQLWHVGNAPQLGVRGSSGTGQQCCTCDRGRAPASQVALVPVSQEPDFTHHWHQTQHAASNMPGLTYIQGLAQSVPAGLKFEEADPPGFCSRLKPVLASMAPPTQAVASLSVFFARFDRVSNGSQRPARHVAGCGATCTCPR